MRIDQNTTPAELGRAMAEVARVDPLYRFQLHLWFDPLICWLNEHADELRDLAALVDEATA